MIRKIAAVILSVILALSVFALTVSGAEDFQKNELNNSVNTVIPFPFPDFNSVKVTYHNTSDGSSFVRSYSKDGGGTFTSQSYFLFNNEGKALAGWAAEEGGAIVYDIDSPVPTDAGDLDVWAVWTELCLGDDEIFSFNNSPWYFETDAGEGYYMNEDDYRAMQLNLFKTFGPGPVPSPVMAIVLATYPNWEWRGSCYGMSAVAALQHFGKIDVLSLQNASSLSDLESDDDLVSFINYYQSQATTSWLTENKAAVPGSPMYKAQLSELFDTVRNGNLVLFTFYQGEAFITSGHAVLMTGAYDAANGEHVLIAYDCNEPWDYDADGYDSRFVISDDFSSISYYGDKLGAFNWTKNFDQFESFSIKTDGNPLIWYGRLFLHIADVFSSVFKAIQIMLGI